MLLLPACSLEQQPTVTAPPPATTTSTFLPTTGPPEEGTAPTSTLPEEEACPEGDVMLADGRLMQFDRPQSEGTRIAGITWDTTGGCHTLTISFATEDGAPATSPPSLDARLMRNLGILRIDTAATASVVVDQRVEEGWVDRLFVPQREATDDEAYRFIDLVLSGPAVARARILSSPARLVIELQPGGPEVGRPLVSPQVVVVEPGSAAVAEPVLDVTGYSTGELGSLQLAVLDGDQEVVGEALDLEPSPTVWREFSFPFQVGTTYDTLRVTTEDGSVVAAIPLSPGGPPATSP